MKKIPVAEIYANPSTYIAPVGHVTVNTTTNTLSIHDGETAGGVDVGLSPAQVVAGAVGVAGVTSGGAFIDGVGQTIPSLTASQVDWVQQSMPIGDSLASVMLVAKTNQTYSRTSVNSAADVTFSTLYSFTVPGGLMGPNGSLMYEMEHQYTSSASPKGIQLYVGSTAISPEITLGVSTTNDNWRHALHNTSVTTQKYRGSRVVQGANSTGFTTATIDTSVDFVVLCRCHWGSAQVGETISLVSLRAWVEYGG